MEKILDILKKVKLFKGINEETLSTMLSYLGAKQVSLAKNEAIILAGEKADQIGVLVSGSLHIVRDSIDGERTLISAVFPNEIFAEAFCCTGVVESPASVIAALPSTVIMLNYKRIFSSCPHSCEFHQKLIENMLMVLAEKNIMLQNRMQILEKKTVRLKVLALLESYSTAKSKMIVIPFNREQLADFLCVDRSALSHELSRMKQDGLIDYHKNVFKLL